MSQKLTDTRLRSAKPKDYRYELRDGKGLSLWVYPTGRKTWVFTYAINGKKRRVTLGKEYPETPLTDARDLHRDAHTLVSQGIDPVEHERAQEEEKRARAAARAAEERSRLAEEETKRAEEEARRVAESLEPTVSKLIDSYIEKYAKRVKRTWAEDERQLKKDVVPVLGDLKARDVTRGHIRALLDSVVERGAPIAANRLLAVVQRMFSWAADKEIILASPCLNLKMPSGEVPKDRVLSESEVRAFWHALDSLPRPFDKKGKPRTARREVEEHAISDDVRRALKLILVTGQRPGEVTGATWEEIEGAWWTIPAERAKNGNSHRVPLSNVALEILGPRGTGYVFRSPRKENGPIHRSALAHALRDNRQLMGVAEFAPHDLRRTAASLMASIGVSPFTVERVLNHSLGKIQKIYNRHSYDAEKREALNRWAAHLERLLDGKSEAKVVSGNSKR